VQKKIAYYLRNMGLIQVVGKKGNAPLYAITHKDTGR
jgi:chromosome segregation and condensation protein ScpB